MVRIVRLGTPRAAGEGLRLGTVRRPPRGVRKSDFARLDYYDLWLPALSPSAPLVSEAQRARSDADWRRFFRKFEAELENGAGLQLLDLLAALSHSTNFSVGCYCEDESHCHRATLRKLLTARGAAIVRTPCFGATNPAGPYGPY